MNPPDGFDSRAIPATFPGMKFLKTWWPVLAGLVLGAALGYYGQCTSGACVFTSTWWGGAAFGGVLGALLGPGTR